MSVDHWTNHLTPEEEHAVDYLELEILRLREEAKALREKHRKIFFRATNRMKRVRK